MSDEKGPRPQEDELWLQILLGVEHLFGTAAGMSPSFFVSMSFVGMMSVMGMNSFTLSDTRLPRMAGCCV